LAQTKRWQATALQDRFSAGWHVQRDAPWAIVTHAAPVSVQNAIDRLQDATDCSAPKTGVSIPSPCRTMGFCFWHRSAYLLLLSPHK
jgi:hypothetical protein